MTTIDFGRLDARRQGRYGAVKLWLSGVILLVFCMIVVGGATRLTDSGLSITEWQPILGAIPPLSDADWLAAFEKYKQIPEYHIVNKGMSLDAFKTIFWWEWAHRFLGRIIGVAFLVPLVFFWATRRLPAGLGGLLFAAFLLGGLQGAIGWYMVQSGLADRIDVSHYRLALHLTTAFVILALLTWLRLQIDPPPRGIDLDTIPRRHRTLASIILAVVFLQVVLGAFVAGLKAGLTYNTWPLMDGELIPTGLFSMSPWWINLTENITTIQFDHRMVAYLLAAIVVWHAVALARTSDDARCISSAAVLACAVFAQAVVGIFTLISAEGAIPLGLGLVHQGGAAIVLMIAVWHLHRLRQTVAG